MRHLSSLLLLLALTACGGSTVDEPDDKQTIDPVLCLAHDTNPSCAH